MDFSCLVLSCLVLSCLVLSFGLLAASRFPDPFTKMKFTAITFSVLATATVHVHAHSRIACPPARNMNSFASTSIKYGPCGDDTGNFTAPVIEISPGFIFSLSLSFIFVFVFVSVFGLYLTRPALVIAQDLLRCICLLSLSLFLSLCLVFI
jgi:hypothetical protein